MAWRSKLLHEMAGLFTLGILCLSGCGQPAGPQRVAVRGKIEFNGVPLKAGRISFLPTGETKGPPAVATVTDGAYQFDAKSGPVVGKNKVQIESLPDPGFPLDDEAAYAKAAEQKRGMPVLPRETIPPEYNTRSTLMVDVPADPQQPVDFALKPR